MKVIKLPQYQGNIIRALKSLELVETENPVPRGSQVFIEIEAAPCNPSDIAFIQGGYNVRKTLPATPGFEGSGRVIATGESKEASALNGRHVSFFSQANYSGSWASHVLVDAKDCIPLDNDLPIDQAACFSVNPFTAYAMVELAKSKSASAIIQNAAGGQVANFVHKLASLAGIMTINIVRKEQHLTNLRSEGFEHVLCSAEEGFSDKLKDLARQLDACIAFDAVGGEQSGIILGCMPEDSTLYLYGALGARTLSEIPATEVIFKKKRLQGFNMNEWKAALRKTEFQEIVSTLQQYFRDKTLETRIQGNFALADHDRALMQYIRNMSGGKIIFKA